MAIKVKKINWEDDGKDHASGYVTKEKIVVSVYRDSDNGIKKDTFVVGINFFFNPTPFINKKELPDIIDGFKTIKEAKALAEKEYEKFIRSLVREVK